MNWYTANPMIGNGGEVIQKSYRTNIRWDGWTDDIIARFNFPEAVTNNFLIMWLPVTGSSPPPLSAADTFGGHARTATSIPAP